MRNDPLIPNLAVVTDIRVDTPDVKTLFIHYKFFEKL